MMENTQMYPVILRPTPGATLALPIDGQDNNKVYNHGQSELIILARLFKYCVQEIREDVRVRICGHNYEPDFAYVNRDKGVCIDIEIDEPYAISGHAIHFMTDDGKNVDSVRNQRFQNAGWYVIRFSEEQMFCHTAECLREIYKLAKEAGAVDEIPDSLQGAEDLLPVRRWDKNGSHLLWRNKFRKSYLGYDLRHLSVGGVLRCSCLLLPVLWQSLFHSRVRRSCCACSLSANNFFDGSSQLGIDDSKNKGKHSDHESFPLFLL